MTGGGGGSRRRGSKCVKVGGFIFGPPSMWGKMLQEMGLLTARCMPIHTIRELLFVKEGLDFGGGPARESASINKKKHALLPSE